MNNFTTLNTLNINLRLHHVLLFHLYRSNFTTNTNTNTMKYEICSNNFKT